MKQKKSYSVPQMTHFEKLLFCSRGKNKEIWYFCSIWYFWSLFIPISKTISIINRSGPYYFYTHQTNGKHAGMCACDHMHQMEKTDTSSKGSVDSKNCYKITEYSVLFV